MKDNGIIFDEEEIQQLVGVLIEELIGEKACTKSTGIQYRDMRRLLDRQKGLAAALATR